MCCNPAGRRDNGENRETMKPGGRCRRDAATMAGGCSRRMEGRSDWQAGRQAIKFSPQAARHGIVSLGKIVSFPRAPPAGLSRGVEK